jgi:hypothetical protein
MNGWMVARKSVRMLCEPWLVCCSRMSIYALPRAIAHAEIVRISLRGCGASRHAQRLSETDQPVLHVARRAPVCDAIGECAGTVAHSIVLCVAQVRLLPQHLASGRGQESDILVWSARRERLAHHIGHRRSRSHTGTVLVNLRQSALGLTFGPFDLIIGSGGVIVTAGALYALARLGVRDPAASTASKRIDTQAQATIATAAGALEAEPSRVV